MATPIYPYVTPWTWTGSNGPSASAAETMAAYNALVSKDYTIKFSYKVWNDIIDKINTMRTTSGRAWNTRYATLLNTKMNSSSNLLATMFNSSVANTGYPYWKWWLDDDSVGYLGREFVQGASQVGSRADIVYGAYFIELLNAVNIILGVYNGTIERLEIAEIVQASSIITGDAVAKQSSPITSSVDMQGILLPDFSVVPPRALTVNNSTALTFNNVLDMLLGGLLSTLTLITFVTTQLLLAGPSASFSVDFMATLNTLASAVYSAPFVFTLDSTIASLMIEPSAVSLSSLPMQIDNKAEGLFEDTFATALQSLNINTTSISRGIYASAMNTSSAYSLSFLETTISNITSALLSLEVQLTFAWIIRVVSTQRGTLIVTSARAIEPISTYITSIVSGSISGGTIASFIHDALFISTQVALLNTGTAARLIPINEPFISSIVADLIVNRVPSTDLIIANNALSSVTAEISVASRALPLSASIQLESSCTLLDLAFITRIDLTSTLESGSIITAAALQTSNKLVEFYGTALSEQVEIVAINLGRKVDLEGAETYIVTTIESTMETEGSTWVYPVQTGSTLYIQQAYHISQENEILRLEQQSIAETEHLEVIVNTVASTDITAGFETLVFSATDIEEASLSLETSPWMYPVQTGNVLRIPQVWKVTITENNLEAE